MRKVLFFVLILTSFFILTPKADAAGNRFKIDLGASGYRTNLTGWNNIYLPTDTTTWYSLVNTEGATSSAARIKISSPFTASLNTGGATTSSAYPDTATRDSFVANASTTPQLLIDGLNPNNVYKFNFYVSTKGTASEGTTYKLSGLSVASTSLYSYANIDNYATIDNFRPDATGQVVLDLSKATGSFSANYWLGILDFYELMGVTVSEDQSIKYNQGSVTISGQATSIGGAITSYLWEQVSGPAISIIASTSSATTTVSGFTAPGDYVFKMTANDDRGYYSSDTLTVSVNMVDAGIDRVVVRPNTTVNLSGSVLDYDENIQLLWSEITTNQSWIVSTSSLSTLVKDLVPGTYTFRLSATKGSLTQSDDIQVIVQNNPLTVMQASKKVVIMGDSTAWGAGSSPMVAMSYLEPGAYPYAWGDNAWAALFNSYFTGFNASNTVINIAKIGLNSYQAMPDGSNVNSRPSVLTDFNITKALSYNPDLLIVGLSTNDAASFWGMDEMVNNLQTFKNLAAAQGVPVWFFMPHPRAFSDDVYYTALEKRARLVDLINLEQAAFPGRLINIYDDFYNPDRTIKDAYNSGDGVHMNNTGHRKMYNRVVASNLVEYLGNRRPSINTWTADQDINTDSSVSLEIEANDQDGQELNYSWQQISGPIQTNINSATSSSTLVSGFSQAGQYTFKAIATDIYASSSDKTINVNVSAVESAPYLSNIISTVSSSSALINFSTDVNALSSINFGVTESYGNLINETPYVGKTNHQINLTELLACTTYNYALTASSSSAVSTSTNLSFTTTGCSAESTVIRSTAASVSNLTGGSVLNTESGKGLSLFVPSNFNINSELTFQIKKLNNQQFFSAINTPENLKPVSSYIYNLEALLSTSTKISSFAKPLTVVINYNREDLGGLMESSLVIKRYSGGTWYGLSNCVVNTASSSVSCETSSFSDFALFGEEEVVASSSSSLVLSYPVIATNSLVISINGDSLNFDGVSRADYYSLSYVPDFSQSSWVKYSSSTSINKFKTKAYVKFRNQSGGESQVFIVNIPMIDTNEKSQEIKNPAQVINQTLKNIPLMKFFKRQLKLGDRGDDVKKLQILLNKNGFNISNTGPGSMGRETIYFGLATKKALVAFQKKNKLYPYPGVVGPGTIKILNSLIK